MKRPLQLFWAALIYTLTLPLAVLPYRISLKVGALIGELAFHLWTQRREIAVDNIKRAIETGALKGELTAHELARRCFRNLGRSLMEVLKIYHGFGEVVFRNTEIEGIEHFREAMNKGKGVLLITGHCGNWELLALYSSFRVTPLKVVARALNNPFLNRLVERTRGRYGNRVIYKEGALRQMIRELRGGGAVGILIDQGVLPSEGVKIPFLGRPAWTMRTPAVLATKTGAGVVPVFIKRT
ncbi:MAG: lipid A biosynthesis acyltransferase, partial [Nitrospirae bacterium]